MKNMNNGKFNIGKISKISIENKGVRILFGEI